MTFYRLIDKDGNVSHGTRYSGIVYSDKDGKPDETKRFTRWEDWVEHHDQRESQINDVLTRSIGQFVRELVAPLKARISQLEATLGEFGYRGMWQEGIVYRAGNFVTLSGSMWHCEAAETTSRPTTDNPEWSLAVKRGRDAPRNGHATEPRKPTQPRMLSHNT